MGLFSKLGPSPCGWDGSMGRRGWGCFDSTEWIADSLTERERTGRRPPGEFATSLGRELWTVFPLRLGVRSPNRWWYPEATSLPVLRNEPIVSDQLCGP